jgi:hypothetical protein
MKAQYRLPFPHQFIPQWNKINYGGWDDPVATVHPGYWAYDFEIPEGTEVRAARSGTVIAAVRDRVKGEADKETGSGGGNFVLVRHFDSTVASYAHLMTDRVFVDAENYVAQGQVIALSGFTGRAAGPHLHMQVMMWGSDESNLGPTMPMLFEDAVHDVWKPVAGEVHRSNNTVLRQDNWRWCQKCHLLFFAGGAAPAGPVGSCPDGGGGHDGSASAGYVLAMSAPNHDAQPGWRWCSNCSALVFGNSPSTPCPGHRQHAVSGSGEYFVRFGAGAPSAQPGWRWCATCQGLFLGSPGSVCAATAGPHSAAGSGQYVVDQVIDLHHVVQPNWLWCRKCSGLFFGGNPGSVCPLDRQAHDGSQSSAYTLPLEAAQTLGQPGWRWCHQCQGLFFGGNTGSLCPATGPHSATGSGHYVLHLDLPKAPGQPGWRWCDRCQGLFFGDAPGSVCPTGDPHSQVVSGDYKIW